ncbi:hypothetical protein M9H77_11091 [Catharanthus roseus]|uniref:Uncharacterized protein n=1 Tax=Catharanthus roseus TaxID=4058 RepID=A0ACC0BDM0_CATRO|nr:hypothetical protein M9H77_11091 [Catharanthus roseus]
MYGRDLNEILFVLEKVGMRERSQRQIYKFREMINEVRLNDLGYKGPDYTWFNGREKGAEVWERLDQCFATDAWRERFNQTQVVHDFTSYLDHAPFIEKRREALIKSAWGCWKFCGMHGIKSCMQMVTRSLEEWDKKFFRDLSSKINGMQRRLQQLMDENGEGYMEQTSPNRGAPRSSNLMMKSTWASFWEVRVSLKVKQVLWRACHEILSTKVNLRKRKILDDDSCPRSCRSKEEDGHLFFRCEWV